MRPQLLLLAIATAPGASGVFIPPAGFWSVPFTVNAGSALDTTLWTPSPTSPQLVFTTTSARSLSNSRFYVTSGGVYFAQLQTGGGVDVSTSLVSVPFFAARGTVVEGYTLFDTFEDTTGAFADDYSASWLENTASAADSVLLDRSTVTAPNGPLLTWRRFSTTIAMDGNYRFNFSIANAGPDNTITRRVAPPVKLASLILKTLTVLAE